MARYYESKTLIEFVKKYTPTINGETTMKCVERAIREAPTADVVPKSEVVEVIEETFKRIKENFAISPLCKSALSDLEAELKKKYTEGNNE